MGLSRTPNETTKPWAYFNFTSEESMQSAMKTAPALNGRQLVWASPDDVRLFCPKCSSPEHKAKTVMIYSLGVKNLHLKPLYQLIKNMVLSLQPQSKLIRIAKTTPRKLLLIPEIVLLPEVVLIILQDLTNRSPMQM